MGDVPDPQTPPVPKADTENADFYSLLPEFLQEKLRDAQLPLTEDEEEMFILQKNQINKNDQKNQLEEVLRKVRIADIKPDLLVFARYLDKNYYSAVVKEAAKGDRWTVQFNLDGCVIAVREVYILPTEILPKGTKCHVMHPQKNYSDPGMVKGHMYQDGILIHIIEIHKGHVVKATHSHINLSPDEATKLNESRLSFRSMIASPGGDVSLDNIVPGKRRRETSSSPVKRLQMGLTPPPRSRKQDSNLDDTESSADKKKKSSKSEAITRVPTAFSETSSSTDAEAPRTPIDTPKTSKKKVPRKTPLKATGGKAKSNKKTTKKMLFERSREEDQSMEEETPKKSLKVGEDSAKKSSKVGEESAKKSSKVGEESAKKSSKFGEDSAKKSSKVGEESAKKSSRKKNTTKGKKKPAEGEETPKKAAKGLFLPPDAEATKGAGKSKESLLNPVVELIQLEEVSVSPRSSPKSAPKKRGRRPGSTTKNPKKALKMEQEDSSREESTEEMDPRLGTLPPSGCSVFQGYSILITHAGNPQSQDNDEVFLPMKRDYLKEQICSAGGRVVDTFEEAYREHLHNLQTKKPPAKDDYTIQYHYKKSLPAADSPSRVLCISNSYCRTAKYIQCLTVGIPLVNMRWIISSVEQNKCLNWLDYLLPAGLSLMTGTVMEQTFGDAFKDATTTVGKVVEVLKGEKVFLASSSNPEFGELWLNLLTVADAVVFKVPPKGGNIQRLIDRRTTVVIADSSIPDEELKRARDANVPIVSSEWFIQSLLARCKLPYDAQPEFKYDHKVNVKNVPEKDCEVES